MQLQVQSSGRKVMPRRCPPGCGQGKEADNMMESLSITMGDRIEAVDGRLGQIISEAL